MDLSIKQSVPGCADENYRPECRTEGSVVEPVVADSHTKHLRNGKKENSVLKKES